MWSIKRLQVTFLTTPSRSSPPVYTDNKGKFSQSKGNKVQIIWNISVLEKKKKLSLMLLIHVKNVVY